MKVSNLKQNARLLKKSDGNENIKLYHLMINKRKRMLVIPGVEGGEWVIEPQRVKQVFLQFKRLLVDQFSTLVQTFRPRRSKKQFGHMVVIKCLILSLSN